MILFAASLTVALSSPLSARFEEIDFAANARRQIELSYEPVASAAANHGSSGGQQLRLPTQRPFPSYRGSRFSTIYRARDLFDVTNFPIRAVAKLHRLNADGSRSATACTAQFVGPRHLITAAHCIADPNSGTVHPGFEIAIGYDAGEARKVARITRAWIEADKMRLARPEDALVVPERCSDLAAIEIAEPLGVQTGWLGMHDLTPGTGGAADAVLHRFAYPHTSAAANADRDIANAPEPERADVEAHYAEVRRNEPDFSPANLYYEFGQPDEMKGRYIAYHTPYSAPGRSGSALIDGDARIVALASRGYSGTFYSCRLTSADIGAIRALIARASS